MFISLAEYRDAMKIVASGGSYLNPIDLIRLREMYDIMRFIYDHSCERVCTTCPYVTHDNDQHTYCLLCHYQDMIASMLEEVTVG